jgi:hypothetical protein
MCSGSDLPLPVTDLFDAGKKGAQAVLKNLGLGGAGAPPAVTRTDPKADAEKVAAEAAAAGAAAGVARRRRVRASSLLATGGQGDTSPVSTSAPAAKDTLGA